MSITKTPGRFKKYILIISILIVFILVYFVYDKVLAVPCHPLWFFNDQTKHDLAELSKSLLNNVEEEWLWIDSNSIRGPEYDKSYLQKYKSDELMSLARNYIKNSPFQRIHLCNKSTSKYVAFACYRKDTRTMYFYVYFLLIAPEVPHDKRKYARKIENNWWFGAVLPSCK